VRVTTRRRRQRAETRETASHRQLKEERSGRQQLVSKHSF
jgi:hypothetical protein